MKERVIVFYGEDSFYIKLRVNQVIKKYNLDEYNTTYYDLDEIDLKEAVNDALTIPFMSDQKLVVCNNAKFLGTEKVTKGINHDEDALAQYLANPSDSTILILTAPIAKLDERKALVKQLKKYTVSECKLKTAQDLAAWARRQFGQLGIHFDEDALNLFIKRVEHSTEFAYLEMRKLLLYVGDEKFIDKAVVERVTTKNVEDNVYDITTALLQHNQRKALGVYKDLVLHSEDPLRILNIIITKYREMLHVRTLLEQGKSQSDIQAYYNVSSGRAYYMVQNAKVVELDKIKEHLKHLERLDYNIKTGRVDKKIGLELFILST